MKRLLTLLGLASLLMGARPGTEFQLLTNLNGEEVRWSMTDGGWSGIFGTGTACMQVKPSDGGTLGQVPAAANNVVQVMPMVPINLCERSVTVLTPNRWDGGCSTYPGDQNFGTSLQPGVPKFVVLRDSTTHLCAASDGGTVIAPVSSMQ